MKTILTTLFILAQATPLAAQRDSSGVYLTALDYVNHKLTTAISCSSKKHDVKINAFLNKPYITLTKQGKKYQYNKTDVFGYRNCSKVFRFANTEEYEILNNKAIFLYVQQQLSLENKGSSTESLYFFSRDAQDAIKPLSIAALKQAYPDNQKFQDLLDQMVREEMDLMAYDRIAQAYKVESLLKQSLK